MNVFNTAQEIVGGTYGARNDEGRSGILTLESQSVSNDIAVAIGSVKTTCEAGSRA